MENNTAYPTPNEQTEETIFSADEFSMQGYDKHIRQARNAIFGVAILLVINLLVLSGTVPEGYEYLWLDLIIWGVFVAAFVVLGSWANKKPYYAIVLALVLYLVFIGLNAALDVSTIFKGIIFKIIVIVFLVKGINDAKEAQEMKKQLGL